MKVHLTLKILIVFLAKTSLDPETVAFFCLFIQLTGKGRKKVSGFIIQLNLINV